MRCATNPLHLHSRPCPRPTEHTQTLWGRPCPHPTCTCTCTCTCTLHMHMHMHHAPCTCTCTMHHAHAHAHAHAPCTSFSLIGVHLRIRPPWCLFTPRATIHATKHPFTWRIRPHTPPVDTPRPSLTLHPISRLPRCAYTIGPFFSGLQMTDLRQARARCARVRSKVIFSDVAEGIGRRARWELRSNHSRRCDTLGSWLDCAGSSSARCVFLLDCCLGSS
jgi:hypothetical protein